KSWSSVLPYLDSHSSQSLKSTQVYKIIPISIAGSAIIAPSQSTKKSSSSSDNNQFLWFTSPWHTLQKSGSICGTLFFKYLIAALTVWCALIFGDSEVSILFNNNSGSIGFIPSCSSVFNNLFDE